MTVGFVSLGLVQEDPDDVIIIVVGETPAPLPEGDEIVCEISVKQKMSLNPDFEFFRRDNHAQQFRITLGGDSYDITDAQLRFSARYKPTGELLFQKKNAAAGGGSSEIQMVDPSTGRCLVFIVPADTEDLDGDTKYYYDLEMIDGGQTTTVKKGFFNLIQDITY